MTVARSNEDKNETAKAGKRITVLLGEEALIIRTALQAGNARTDAMSGCALVEFIGGSAAMCGSAGTAATAPTDVIAAELPAPDCGIADVCTTTFDAGELVASS